MQGLSVSTTELIFAGIDVSSGRKPLAYAVIDHDLKVVLLERCDSSYILDHLDQHKKVMLGVNLLSGRRSRSSQGVQKIHSDIKQKIIHAGFKPYLTNNAPKQWVETKRFRIQCRSRPERGNDVNSELWTYNVVMQITASPRSPSRFN